MKFRVLVILLSLFILFPTYSVILDKNDSNPETNLEKYYPYMGEKVDYHTSTRYFIIKYDGFDVCYDAELDTVVWTIYRLTKEMVENAEHERSDNLCPENDIFGGTPSPSDYRDTGYDRGRLVPAADMAYSFDAIEDTFYMSNIAPQIPKLNRRYWKALEDEVRDRAVLNKEIIVITGVVPYHDSDEIYPEILESSWFDDKNGPIYYTDVKYSEYKERYSKYKNELSKYYSSLARIAIGSEDYKDRERTTKNVPNTELLLPSYFYKIIYAPMTVWNEPFISSFIFPNSLDGDVINVDGKIITYNNCEDYTDFETNIYIIENIAGIDFNSDGKTSYHLITYDDSKLDTKQFGHLMDPDPQIPGIDTIEGHDFMYYYSSSWDYFTRWEWYLPYINKK